MHTLDGRYHWAAACCSLWRAINYQHKHFSFSCMCIVVFLCDCVHMVGQNCLPFGKLLSIVFIVELGNFCRV